MSVGLGNPSAFPLVHRGFAAFQLSSSWVFRELCIAAIRLSKLFGHLLHVFLSFVSLDLSSRCVIAWLFGAIAGIVAEHVACDSACVAIHQSCRCGEHERRFSNQFREKTNQQLFMTFNRLVQTTRSTGTGFCFSLSLTRYSFSQVLHILRFDWHG